MSSRSQHAQDLGRFAALSPDGCLDELADIEVRLAALQAEQVQVLAALAARPPAVSRPGCVDKNWVREQVACILGCSADYAGMRLAHATALARLPGAIGLLARRQVTAGYLRLLAERTASLDEAIALAVAERVLPRAAQQSYPGFRASVARAVLALAPQTDAARRVENVASRRVRFKPWDLGVTAMWTLLPDETAAAIHASIHALATQVDPADERTRDQREADALAQLILTTGTDAGPLRRELGLRPTIAVSVALSTLLGCDQQPGEIAGLGPIPAALARRLAGDPTGTWRRLVTDPRGRLIDYGRTTYRPPTALAEHITARDRTCRFPGCTRRATTCQIDHRTAWADGGQTNAANLPSLCPRHHHLKDETTWTSHPDNDGGTEWIDPHGRRHYQECETYPIDTTLTNPPDEDIPTDPDPPTDR